MRTPSAHHADVFSHLRAAVGRELDTPEVAALLEDLLGRGWRPEQLRHRVGLLPAQPSSAQDAQVIVELLCRLRDEGPPQVRWDAERATRERHRAFEVRAEAPVATPQETERWIASIRGGLKGLPRAARPEKVRLRPDCAVCAGEAEFFVRRDVHLCTRCVDLLAGMERQRGGSGSSGTGTLGG